MFCPICKVKCFNPSIIEVEHSNGGFNLSIDGKFIGTYGNPAKALNVAAEETHYHFVSDTDLLDAAKKALEILPVGPQKDALIDALLKTEGK